MPSFVPSFTSPSSFVISPIVTPLQLFGIFFSISNTSVCMESTRELDRRFYAEGRKVQSELNYLLKLHSEDQTLITAENLKDFLLKLKNDFTQKKNVLIKMNYNNSRDVERLTADLEMIDDYISTTEIFIEERLNSKLDEHIQHFEKEHSTKFKKLVKQARTDPLSKLEIDLVLEHHKFNIMHSTKEFRNECLGYPVIAAYIGKALPEKGVKANTLLWDQDLSDIGILKHEWHHMAVHCAHFILSPQVMAVLSPFYPIDSDSLRKMSASIEKGSEMFADFRALLTNEAQGKSLSLDQRVRLKAYKNAASTFNVEPILMKMSYDEGKVLQIGKIYNFNAKIEVDLGDFKVVRMERADSMFLVYVIPQDCNKALLYTYDSIDQRVKKAISGIRSEFRHEVSDLNAYDVTERFSYLRQYFSLSIMKVFYNQASIEYQNFLELAKNKAQEKVCSLKENEQNKKQASWRHRILNIF